MREWKPTLEELSGDLWRVCIASRHLEPVHTDARIAFHDATQEAVRVITPDPRYMAALMAGGYVRRARWVCDEDGRPVLEGPEEAHPTFDDDGNLIGIGEAMGPMTEAEAVEFIAWKDMPRGVNHFSIITTGDLPRIDGDIDKARKFRDAWRLKEAA